MKRSFFPGAALLALAWPATAQSQGCTPPAPQAVSPGLADEIARLNADMAAARTAGDADRLLVHFAPDSLIMPEHQQRLFGLDQGKAYYRSLFSRLDMTRYTAETQDILAVPGGALEWGTFRLDYAPATGGPAQATDGKYMHLWRRQADGTLKLKAEDWRSGDRVWLVELISPFATPENKLSEAMLLDLMQGPFKTTVFNLHRTDPNIGVVIETLYLPVVISTPS